MCLETSGVPFPMDAAGRYDGSGRFFYGGKYRAASVGFDSGNEVSAVVDRTHSGNGSNGVVRFLRNGKALAVELESLPIGFAEAAVFVVSFNYEGGSVKTVSFE